MARQQKSKIFEPFSKRAQMEMMGLIMIVVIISFMLVFGLLYVKSYSDKEFPEQAFGERSFGTGFVSVLADTYVENCEFDYSVLAKDCATDQSIICNGDNSCTVAAEVAAEILAETLDLWGENYRFRIMTDTETFLDLQNPNYLTEEACNDNMPKEAPGIELIPLYPTLGDAQLKLEICKN